MLPVILATFVVCFLVERLRPGWSLPRVPTWPLRVLAMNAVQLVVVLLAGVSWERWFSAASLFHLSAHVSPATGGLVAYFIATFVFYWWHRVRHTNDTLWRLFHQIHHSTHRLQTATALYSHPLDYASTLLIINVVAYSILGFDAERAAWTTAWVGVFELWEHTNIRTPRWLGFVIVRPEMHRIHHELNRHRNNYGLPLWDMLFGTYENSHREVLCGFSRERESRLREMLRFRDVHKS